MSDLAIEILKGGWPILGFAGILFIISLVVFGFMPGLLNRTFARIYPRTDPRRAEMIAELYAVRRIEQPWWVFQQGERAIFEGLSARRKGIKASPELIQVIARNNDSGGVGGKYPTGPELTFTFTTSKNLDDKSCLRVVRELAGEVNSDYIAIPAQVAADKALDGTGWYRIRRLPFTTKVTLRI